MFSLPLKTSSGLLASDKNTVFCLLFQFIYWFLCPVVHNQKSFPPLPLSRLVHLLSHMCVCVCIYVCVLPLDLALKGLGKATKKAPQDKSVLFFLTLHRVAVRKSRKSTHFCPEAVLCSFSLSRSGPGHRHTHIHTHTHTHIHTFLLFFRQSRYSGVGRGG
jgi:hypothetical protein